MQQEPCVKIKDEKDKVIGIIVQNTTEGVTEIYKVDGLMSFEEIIEIIK